MTKYSLHVLFVSGNRWRCIGLRVRGPSLGVYRSCQSLQLRKRTEQLLSHEARHLPLTFRVTFISLALWFLLALKLSASEFIISWLTEFMISLYTMTMTMTIKASLFSRLCRGLMVGSSGWLVWRHLGRRMAASTSICTWWLNQTLKLIYRTQYISQLLCVWFCWSLINTCPQDSLQCHL